MATRIPLFPVALPRIASTPLEDQSKSNELQSFHADPHVDENAAPLGDAGGDIAGLHNFDDFSHSPIDMSDAQTGVNEESDGDDSDAGEAEDVASDGESDEDSSDDMARFLAFANRSRASGSGLPAALAHLGRAVNSADDEDKETVSMFAVAVASVIKEDREIERMAIEIMRENDQEGSVSGSSADEPFEDASESQSVLRASLARMAAFRRLGVTRLDATATQGLSVAKLRRKGRSVPLRRQFLRYLCEIDVYTECSRFGIEYEEPLPYYD
ncbi:hypothetical protein ONZ51_g6688 [Trametes cubensis]|uniref:Uncharacterized protein n=1 Tax=Trametes cubensis TaxID=1111947 RepID=A0AAD7TRN7_9APHY|nr:hypothetical protein ONZ51_g6688 [Trametes cubensis]